MQLPYFLITGLCAGVLAGLFGVGGGLVVVPMLVFLVGFSQQAAAGTSLVALLAPVGAAGVYAFYQAGKINATHFKAGLLISLGMFVGSYFGARLSLAMSDFLLKRVFSIFLFAVAVKFWFSAVPGVK
jgi:uncharacterized membrane protein YfcA